MTAVCSSAESAAKLLDVEGVAEILGCSPRHVRRLSDAGKMPPPVKLGALVRWPRSTLESWIAAGCLAVQNAAGDGGAQ
jgi:excisionase family DNA binding protein